MTHPAPPTTDPVQDCLKAVLAFYGLKPDMKGLRAAMPRGPGKMERADIAGAADRLGLAAASIAARPALLRARALPAIVPLRGDRVCVYLPPRDGAERVFVPGEGKKDFDFLEKESAPDAPALLFTLPVADGAADTDHMKKGHALDWFWEPMLVFWPRYAEILLCSAFINVLVLAMPLFTMNVYDRVAVNFAESTLAVLTVGVILALCFDFFFKTVRAYILELIAGKMAARFDTDLMERFMAIPATATTLSAGEKANIFRELQGIKDFYATRLAPTLVDIPFFVLFCLVIHAISPPVVIVPVAGAVVILLANAAARLPVGRATRRYFTAMQGKSSFLVETLQGLSAFRMFNAAGYRLFGWQTVSAGAVESARRNHMTVAMVSGFSLLVTQLVQVLVIYTGVYEIGAERLTIGGLVACTIIAGRAMAPVVGLAGVLASLRQTRDVLLTIDKVFRLPHEDRQAHKKSPKGPFTGRLEVQAVSYAYPGQARPALWKASLTVEPGGKVALIGKTGAGKSTLGKMLTGQIEPAEGGVFLDGYAIGAIPPAELRRTVGYVPQDPFFFQGTIRENILMGLDDPGDEALDEAVRMAGLDLVIAQTGEGLDTPVGEGGASLSGGQRQAVSLARALVRRPSILVFDEPTTGMDNALEDRVRQALSVWLKPRTFVMVTHRTSLLSLVDRLVLLDSGRVLADGPRDEILKKLSGGGGA